MNNSTIRWHNEQKPYTTDLPNEGPSATPASPPPKMHRKNRRKIYQSLKIHFPGTRGKPMSKKC